MSTENKERYTRVFCNVMNISPTDIYEIQLKESPEWDSMTHIALIEALEDEFEIDFEPEDIFDLTTFDNGLRILSANYNVA